MRTILVVDIETVRLENSDKILEPFVASLRGVKPRKTKATSLMQMVSEDEDKADIALKKAALSPVSSRIACIGVLRLIIDDHNKVSDSLKIFICDEDEENMLNDLKALITPTVEFVTFNGRSFDFPFLMYRAAILGIPLALPMSSPYNGRDNHYDMFVHLNQLSNMSILSSMIEYVGLGKWCEHFGLPTKPSIKNGDISIEDMIARKAYDELKEYCMGDVDATAFLFTTFIGSIHVNSRYS